MIGEPFIFLYNNDPIDNIIRIKNNDPSPKEGDIWVKGTIEHGPFMKMVEGKWKEDKDFIF